MDSRGHTLYTFDRDTRKKIACVGGCVATWQPFLTVGKPLGVKGVPAAKLGTMKRGAKLQVTFAGHPLYFFVGDLSAGDTNGASVVHWAALSTAGAKLHASTASSGTPAPPPTVTVPGYGDGY